MKYLILFFNWLKKTIAKETLLTVLGIVLALILSFMANTILEYSIKDSNPSGEVTLQSELKDLDIDKFEYWMYLFIVFMLIIYGIRFVESVIKVVLIKKVEKQ